MISKIFDKSFFRYISVGGFAFTIDTGGFLLLLALGLYRPLAASLAGICAVIFHFTVNRSFSFGSFERAIHHQIRTYFIIALICIALNVIIIEIVAGVFEYVAFIAKITATVIVFPISFFGHRYLTFGKGIRGTYRSLIRR